MPLIAVSLAALLIATSAPEASVHVAITGRAEVRDGDTLSIGPVIIRLNGIDAPETGQTCIGAEGRQWDCGAAATAELVALIGVRPVQCVLRERDAYGRLVSDCAVDGIDLSGALIEVGLAWAFTAYSTKFDGLEAVARAGSIGIWSGENQAPWDYRANRWERAAADSPRPGCPIKGNVAASGEQIYHTPWSPVYSRTRIDESKGERWFCDEAEAVSAGWRAPRTR